MFQIVYQEGQDTCTSGS